jgi:hypothetical protein
MKEADRLALIEARERADLARMRFGNAFDGVLRRVAPERLRADALDAASGQFETMRRQLLERIRHWPFALGLLAAALLLTIFWRPARRLGQRALHLAEFGWAIQRLWRRTNEGS